MKMNSLSGILKRADVNITIAEKALNAQDPYEAGEVHDELESIAAELRVEKIISGVSPGKDPEDSKLINEKLGQIENIQIKLETMVDQLGEDDECPVMEGRRLGKERYFYI